MSGRLLPALALAVALPMVLGGCAVGDALQHRTSGRVDTTEALEHAWRSPASQPDRVPKDATGIRFVAETRGGADRAAAAVRVATATALPASCAGVERRSRHAVEMAWAPSALPDTVQRCGNWAVVRVDGGWFGWTPLASEADAHLHPRP